MKPKTKAGRKTTIQPPRSPEPKKAGLFEKAENWLGTRRYTVLIFIASLSLLFTFFLFNMRISEANDDALYIEAAYNFSTNFFGFYTAYAPLYPMLLSILVKWFGVHLFMLKLTSVVFMLLHFYFLFKAFEKRVPYLIIFFILLLSGINSYFLYYASMTFTEHFFMMLQALFLYMFFKTFDKINTTDKFLKQLMLWLPVGFMLFILTMSRNLAAGIIIPVIAFFIFQKKYISIVYFILSFIIFRVPFELFRKLMWGSSNQFSNQFSSLIRQKNPYDASKGLEDFSGFVDRFTGNYGLYICKRFYQILGFLSENDIVIRKGLGFIFFALFLFSIVYIIRKKNKYLLFTFLYVITMTGITFIVLQIQWDQYRFILVFTPLILMIIFTAFYYLVQAKGNFLQFLFMAIMSIFIFTSLAPSVEKSNKNYSTLRRNLSGDKYYGFTNDWANYLKMSEWCGDSLPSSSLVACRKAPMSFIYAKGKPFYPVYTVFSSDPDTVLANFKNNKVTHVLMANLRRNPKRVDGYTINTMQRLMYPVIQKYPNALVLVKQIGDSEPAYLYKINY